MVVQIGSYYNRTCFMDRCSFDPCNPCDISYSIIRHYNACCSIFLFVDYCGCVCLYYNIFYIYIFAYIDGKIKW